jgi:hypothetical protein
VLFQRLAPGSKFRVLRKNFLLNPLTSEKPIPIIPELTNNHAAVNSIGCTKLTYPSWLFSSCSLTIRIAVHKPASECDAL